MSCISVSHVVGFQVLERKDLSKAGDLFSLEDSVIVDELSAVIKALQVTVFFWCLGSCPQEIMVLTVLNPIFRKSPASLSF